MISFGINGTARTVVYDSKIVAMNFPGGDVYTYAKNRTRTCTTYAKAYAPRRSGALSAGIRTDVRSRLTSVVGRVRSTARHSQWVHEGTLDKAPITGNGKRMYLPAYGAYRARKVWAVRGQKANPFLMRALETTMATPYKKP